MSDKFCSEALILAVNLRHGTHGFTSLLKEVLLRNFMLWKNPSTLAGLEPANLGSSGKYDNHETTGVDPALGQNNDDDNAYVDPGVPVVIILTTGSEVRGFDPGRGRWIFSEHKNSE